jgi:ABC-type multidrug transport system fused ATPase/permease subunit
MMWMGAGTASLKARIILNLFCGTVCGVSAYFSTYYLSVLVKSVSDSNTEPLAGYLVIFIFLAALTIIMRWIFRHFTEWLGVSIENNLKKYFYERIFNRPYDWHLHNSVGFFQSMLERTTGTIHNWVWKMPYDYIPGFTVAALFLVYTFTVSVYLFLYFVLCLLIMIAVIVSMLRERMRLDREVSKKGRDFLKVFIDFLYNIRTVKKMNLLGWTKSKINEKAGFYEGANRKANVFNARQWGFMEFFVQAQFLVPLSYFVFDLIKTGQGINVIVMLVGVQWQMGEIGRQIMHILTELAKAKQDFELLQEHIGTEAGTGKGKIKKDWDSIVFKNTFFEFAADNILFRHRVEYFEIRRGDHVAVMGKSGSGKTTFLNLLTHQYNAARGQIEVDGTDYKKLAKKFFDDKFTYISQDIELFDMTLYDNIAAGKNIDRATFQKVVDGCCLNELIDRMGGDLHTYIGEKGVKVSGGEKQRINLARGLLLDRDIMVLDEITANLDPETTDKIWNFIFSEYRDKTIVAISHEPALLKHVNKRLVFLDGDGRAA